MKTKHFIIILLLFVFTLGVSAQDNTPAQASYYGTVSSVEYVTSMASRPGDLIPSDNSEKEAKDKRSIANEIVVGQDTQTEDDYFVRNRNEAEQSINLAPASIVFDGYSSGSQPTDPSLAVGPNHVMVTFNTGFAIYDKSGGQLQGQMAPNPAIFPNGGCCDLTASYDNAADRWVLTFLGSGAQVAVSDGPDPINDGWFIYNIAAINDYQKLSVWSDGYYITENTGGANKVWALERDAMLVGSPSAQILGFDLPGLQTSGFYSPQALNVTNSNLPAAGGATIIYMQDDAWSGVSSDHLKYWTVDVNWTAGNGTISSAQQIPTTPFIGVFDNGSFSNLRQPGGGRPISVDALQATIMNQAQFRKFATHNSAVFNFVVDTDGTSGELAGIRWYELRQSGDNQPWTLHQEGTYIAPDGRHAWHASLAMDAQGNIGMGYTSMSGPSTPSTVQISSYFTGRFSSDPVGTMTVAEGLIANGDAKIPGTRYGDYSKIDVDPNDDSTFWFINEYMNSGRKGVVGVFQVQAGPLDTQAPTDPTNLTASNITASGATLNWTASTDNVGVAHYNVSIDSNPPIVGTPTTNSFNVTGLSPLTLYNASVTAEDAAGNVSGSANTSFTTIDGGTGNGEIAAYFFETGLQGWIDGGSDCSRVNSTTDSFEGAWSVRLRDDSSSSIATSPSLDLTGMSQVEIDFHFKAASMPNGSSFFVEFFDGSSYQVIAQYVFGTDFTNGPFFNKVITLDSANYNFVANNNIRMRNDGSNNGDRIWFDQVIITDTSGMAPVATNSRTLLTNFNQVTNDNIKMYPNPTNSILNIDILDGDFDEILVFSPTGKIVHKMDTSLETISIDVSQFASGMYFVRFTSEGLAFTKRFIKN